MKVMLTHASSVWFKKLGGLGLVIIGSGLLSTSCANSPSSSTTQFSSGNASAITASQFSNQWKQLQRPENRTLYEQARAQPLTTFFTNALNLAPTTPIQMGGHTFDNLHELLAEHSDELQQISDNYGNMGNFADAMGIANLDDITVEQIQAGYDLIDKLFNQGLARTIQADTTQNAATTTTMASRSLGRSHTPRNTGLALTGRTGAILGCVAGGVGAVASVVGAGVACAATLGLACGAGVIGAAAATTGALNACNSMENTLNPSTTPTPNGESIVEDCHLNSEGGTECTSTSSSGSITQNSFDANGHPTASSSASTPSTQGSTAGTGGGTAEDGTQIGPSTGTIHH